MVEVRASRGNTGQVFGGTVKIQAADGHSFDAYVAQPQGKPRAALVVLQEIFGVNHHIRAVADGFAMFAQTMLDAGFSVAEIRHMAATLPASLVE